MRILSLLIAIHVLLAANAWVPKASVVPVDRLFVTRLNNEQQQERKFAQPRKKFGGDAKLAVKYEEKIKTAGRVGTKRFVDPNKVFIGNLPFSTDADALAKFVLNSMGQSKLVLHSSKVIYEWKTGKSKGYGFVVFTDPIYATVCVEALNGKMLDGRAVTVSQGQKKDQQNQLYLKKKRKAAETDEDAAIASALEEAESDEEFDDDDDDEIPVFGGGSDEDLELDAMLFGLSGDDDEEDGDYDGIFLERKPIYEDVDPNLNREQRREAAKRLRRTKLPHKGFG